MVVTKYTKIFIFFMASLTWIIYLDISNHFQRRKILCSTIIVYYSHPIQYLY